MNIKIFTQSVDCKNYLKDHMSINNNSVQIVTQFNTDIIECNLEIYFALM